MIAQHTHSEFLSPRGESALGLNYQGLITGDALSLDDASPLEGYGCGYRRRID